MVLKLTDPGPLISMFKKKERRFLRRIEMAQETRGLCEHTWGGEDI